MNITNLLDNPILNADSYKTCHFTFMEPGTNRIVAYISPRIGGEYKTVIHFGLQAYLIKYLSQVVTKEMIDQAEVFLTAHGEPFNRAGWEYILNKYNGKFPLRVRAVPEGMRIPYGNATVVVENTDYENMDEQTAAFLATYVETGMLRAGWYGSTVATQSYEMRKLLLEFLEETGDPSLIPFGIIDFGSRGVSSKESSEIGGAAHLAAGNFGTDNLLGIAHSMVYYNKTDVTGYSIQATEHSVTTARGKDGELAFFREVIAKVTPTKPASLVIDSYDMNRAIKYVGVDCKEQLIATGGTLRLRPDSGVPYKVVLSTIKKLDKYFGHTVNAKGYKVLHPSVRVIQGDGITLKMMRKILQVLKDAGYSADNVNFGSGGFLLQQVNRDTCRYAMKASYVEVNGVGKKVNKQPKTDMTKASKGGLLEVVRRDGQIITVEAHEVLETDELLLEEVFYNGEVTKMYDFDQVRANVMNS